MMIMKEGAGRMYYRISMQVSPSDFTIPAFQNGFQITRTYLPGPSESNDVVLHAEKDWKIQKGRVICVRLEVVATGNRYNIAVVDKLPAGLEIDNALLKSQPRMLSWAVHVCQFFFSSLSNTTQSAGALRWV